MEEETLETLQIAGFACRACGCQMGGVEVDQDEIRVFFGFDLWGTMLNEQEFLGRGVWFFGLGHRPFGRRVLT